MYPNTPLQRTNHWLTRKDHLVGQNPNPHLLQGNNKNHCDMLLCCSNMSEVIQLQNSQ